MILCDVLSELRQAVRIHGVSGRQIRTGIIHITPVFHESEVQMRSGGPTCASDKPNDFSLANRFIYFDTLSKKRINVNKNWNMNPNV